MAIYLRRVSVDGSSPAATTALEDLFSTENNRTCISLESHRTTFGNVRSSDVVFVEGQEGNEKDVPYIFRNHAHIIRSVSADGKPTYTIYDHSETGTYIDDVRLVWRAAYVLQAHSLLRFGNENSFEHKAGEKKADPRAVFVFRIEPADALQTETQKRLTELKDRRTKVYSMDMVIKDFGVRVAPTPSVQGGAIVPQMRGTVQQREADSTNNGCPEVPEVNGALPSTSSESPASSLSSATTSSPSSSAVEAGGADGAPRATNGTNGATGRGGGGAGASVVPAQQPSTSWNQGDRIVLPFVPTRAPHARRFDSPQTRHQRDLTDAYNDLNVNVDRIFNLLVPRKPSLAPYRDSFGNLMRDIMQGQPTDLVGLERFIVEFCATNTLTNAAGSKAVLEAKREIAEYLMTDRSMPELFERYAEHGRVLERLDIPYRHNLFAQSSESAFRTAGGQQQQQPQASPPGGVLKPRPLHPLYDSNQYLEKLRELNVSQVRMPQTETATAVRSSPPEPPMPLTPYMHRMLFMAQYSNYQNTMQLPGNVVQYNYLGGLGRSLEMVRDSPGPQQQSQQHGGVIARAPAGGGAPSSNSPEAKKDATMEVDEERHSASSGSTDNNYVRRRTESEDSEIDVVGGMDEDEEEVEVATSSTENSPEPGTEATVAEKKDAAAAEEDETSSTPRIDAQSTSSAVVSAVPSAAPSATPTPLHSPVPKKAPESALHSPKLPEVVVAQVTSPVPAPVDTEVQKKVEENVASIKATMSVVAKTPTAAAATSSSSVTASVAVTLAATPTTTDKKKPAQGHRLKQLDDASSADSESDDDEAKKTKVQKKPAATTSATRKRATPGTGTRRKKPAVSTPVAAADDIEGPDATEAAADTSEVKATPKPRRRAPAKAKAADGEAGPSTSNRRKRKGADAVDGNNEDATPARRRRVARKPAADDGDADDTAEDPKEKCGVATTHCMCKKLEKKKDLQWVSCSLCDQWFHVWCVRLNNDGYGADDRFVCCGDDASPEARRCLDGTVFQEYKAMRIKPQFVSE